jgi:hypothetical protein
MLTEFAFTPSIFDDEAHPDPGAWHEQIRELGLNMFPRVSACPVMVCNLFDGGWHAEAFQAVNRIKDHRLRVLCEGLLARAAEALVRRPPCLDWPTTEIEWAHEALASHRIEPIERIVATDAARTAIAAEGQSIRSIEEVLDGGFWHGISAEATPAMCIADQVKVLHKIRLHADFLCLVTKHIYGGDDDETDFAVALITATLTRPPGFAVPDIEIHTEGPRDPSAHDYAARVNTLTANILRCLGSALQPGQQVRLVIWPKLLDRLLVAGVHTQDANGNIVRSPRWGVAMNHIARAGDARKAIPPTTWTLMKRDNLRQRFDLYCAPGVSGRVRTEIIRG